MGLSHDTAKDTVIIRKSQTLDSLKEVLVATVPGGVVRREPGFAIFF